MTGTHLHGKHIGADADVTVLSFRGQEPTDGGRWHDLWQSAELDAEARKWSWMGINRGTYARTTGAGAYNWYYDVEQVGYKYHGNSIMAAIGLVSLRVRRRRQHYAPSDLQLV